MEMLHKMIFKIQRMKTVDLNFLGANNPMHPRVRTIETGFIREIYRRRVKEQD
jgi:hypothetical protein